MEVRHLAFRALREYKKVMERGRYYQRNSLPEIILGKVVDNCMSATLLCIEDADDYLFTDAAKCFADLVSECSGEVALLKQKLEEVLTKVKHKWSSDAGLSKRLTTLTNLISD